MDDPTLLLRPFPQRDEGPMGYLLWLAESNFMNMRELSQLDIKFDTKCLQYHKLLPDPVLDPDLFAHVENISDQMNSSGRNWNRQQARFCPHCLDESPRWRLAWELIFNDACPSHGVWLVDQCSSCHQPFTWNRDHLLRCPCGADLRAENTSQAPIAVQNLSAALAASTSRSSLHPQLGIELVTGMSVDEIQRLIRFLGGYLDPAGGVKPLKLNRAGVMAVSWPITSLAAQILSDWPCAYHSSLSRLQSANSGEKQGLKGFMQHATYYLYKGLRGQVYDPVRVAFEAWMTEHWQGGIAKRNRRLAKELLAKVQWIPGSVACDELSISKTRLYSLIEEGLLDGQTLISATSKRKFLVVRRDQFEHIRDQVAGEMTMTAAMELLGIGKIRLRRILRLLFKSARRVNNSKFMPWCIPRAEVEALIAIGCDLPLVGIQDEHQVTLAHVLKFWNWTAEEVVALVEAVKAGNITLRARCDNHRGIAAWVFETAHIQAWFRGLNSDRKNWLSIPEVAKLLGIKQQVAYWLAQNGFIAAEKLGTNKGVGSRISRTEYERFRKNHVFCRELASKMGSSSHKVRLMLEDRNIFPLRGESAEPCRQLVYAHCAELHRFVDEIATSKIEFKLVSKGGD